MMIPELSIREEGYTASLNTESKNGLITKAKVTINSELTGFDHEIEIDVDKPFVDQVQRGLSLIQPIDKQLHKVMSA